MLVSRTRLLVLGTVALPIFTFYGCAPSSDPPMSGSDTSSQAEIPEPDVFLTSDQTHARWSATIPPVVTVQSGSVVEVQTMEASDGQFDFESTVADVETVSFDPIHPLTGPVAVEGASPGDVLAVTLLDIEVDEWGWAAIVPGFGFLADRFTDPYYKSFEIDPDASHIRFNDRISVPLAPFPGVMGVAPATDSLLATIPPRANGGNMDNRHMVVGTTIYFPVFVEGANFSIGDTHAAQGDGEVSGTAIEAGMRVRYRIEVVEGARAIEEPQYETDEYYAVTAFATTLDEAARKATGYMIDYLTAEHGLTPEEAYILCSVAGDLKISEVVDVPHMLVSMHMPKEVLGID
ncbi:MAG: acetamidase/formamidase family protein [Gemmatimonadota bacterium]|nr:acetamidase/formamidase family protein [Gemmatimonadota bacterium]MDE3007085.1 acetamidase/formamidase family protein [Gemmatimonadota bacterium]MDE3014725.1 acetamidase/formamidase family protein [Gemmatimonadota bacterium]